jgi:hypothetical protein
MSARVRLQVGGFPRFCERGLLRLTELPFRNRRVLVEQVCEALPALPCNHGDDWPARLQSQRRELIARLVVTRRLVEPSVGWHAHVAMLHPP